MRAATLRRCWRLVANSTFESSWTDGWPCACLDQPLGIGVEGEADLVRLDQVLGLTACAITGLVDDARGDHLNVSDDKVNVETEP